MQELLIQIAAVVGAVATLGGLAWWLVWPRIREGIANVAVAANQPLIRELGTQGPDTLGTNVRRAAQAAEKIPQIQRDIRAIAENQSEIAEWRENTDRRLNAVEQALVALLGQDLKARLFRDDPADDRPDLG